MRLAVNYLIYIDLVLYFVSGTLGNNDAVLFPYRDDDVARTATGQQSLFIGEHGTQTDCTRRGINYNAIYRDSENLYREAIAQNLLQIFFLDTYDKVQRYFTEEQINGSNRKEELFKKFINLVHTYCTTQRDVAFYADQLCISTRYLSAITKQVAEDSAKEIIDENLILELKMALQSTGMSLKEIADKYHFPDQSFFGRYFKKHTGMSPKEYRAKKN